MIENSYTYNLVDDNGASLIDLPVLLQVGAVFYHAFGAYRVEDYLNQNGDPYKEGDDLYIYCEMIYEKNQRRSKITEKRYFEIIRKKQQA
jgi:hypothetical protein